MAQKVSNKTFSLLKSFKLNTNKIFCLRCFVLNFENRERTQSPFSQVDWPKSRFSALDIYYNTFLFLFGRFQLNLTLSRDGLNLSQQKFSRFTLSFCEFQQCEIQRKSSRKKLTSQAFLILFVFRIRCVEYPAFIRQFDWWSWWLSLMYQALNSL